MLTVYFAQKAFVVHKGCILAVRRSATDPHHPHRWEVPGGRLESGEDIDNHIIREVFEETGVKVVPGQPFHVWKWTIKRKESHEPDTIVAVARICTTQTSELNDHGRMVDDNLDLMQWVPIPNLEDYNWISNMLPVLQAFKSQLTLSRTEK